MSGKIIPFPNRRRAENPFESFIDPAMPTRNISPVEGIEHSRLVGACLENDSLEAFGILTGECVLFAVALDRSDLEGRLVLAVGGNGKPKIGEYASRPHGGFTLATRHPKYGDFVFEPDEEAVLGLAVRHFWDTPDGKRVEFDI